jgi:hypothetical protein
VIVIGKQEPSYPRPTATVVGDILTALVQALHSGDMDSHDAPARVPALFEAFSTAAFDFPVVRLMPDLRSLIACHASPVLVPPERHLFLAFAGMAPRLSHLSNLLSQICHPARFTLAAE